MHSFYWLDLVPCRRKKEKKKVVVVLCQYAFSFFRSKDLKTEKSERYIMSEPSERFGAPVFIISPLRLYV